MGVRIDTHKKARVSWVLAALVLSLTSAYCLLRWFALGVIAGKWVGLRGYEERIQTTLWESQLWGIAALILPFVAAFLLRFGLPHPGQSDWELLAKPTALRQFALEIKRYAIRLVISVVSIFALVLLILLLSYLIPQLPRWDSL